MVLWPSHETTPPPCGHSGHCLPRPSGTEQLSWSLTPHNTGKSMRTDNCLLIKTIPFSPASYWTFLLRFGALVASWRDDGSHTGPDLGKGCTIIPSSHGPPACFTVDFMRYPLFVLDLFLYGSKVMWDLLTGSGLLSLPESSARGNKARQVLSSFRKTSLYQKVLFHVLFVFFVHSTFHIFNLSYLKHFVLISALSIYLTLFN